MREGVVEWVKEEGEGKREGTLDEYLLDILGPDFAGAILEHLVMLALGGDDGLAGGLALCGVEGVWLAVHWTGEKCGRGGERDGQGLLYDLRGGGTRTARWVKDPERTKCAKILEMLYCRSGGQDALSRLEIGSVSQ